MLTLHDIVRLGQLDPVGAVHSLKPGQTFINLKDYGTRLLEDRAPCVIGEAQAAIPFLVGNRYWNEGRVHPDMIPIQLRQ